MNVSTFIIYFLGITIITCVGTSPSTFDNNESLRNYQYSLQATKKGSIVIGAHNSNYSVIISYPSIGEEDISSKIIRVQPPITKLSPTIGLAYVGITADCTYLKNKMFEEISNSNYMFGTTPPIGKRLVTSIATRIHRHTLETHLRPFGVKLCIACVDEQAGPQVFEVDGLGSFHSCRMTCLGMYVRVDVA
jgi:20S proteasome alpha/beta subunit